MTINIFPFNFNFIRGNKKKNYAIESINLRFNGKKF